MIDTVLPADRDVHKLCVFTYTTCLHVSNCHIYSFVFVIELPVYWAVRTEYSDGTNSCICELCYKYSFHRPSHSADIHHLLTLAMSWERYTCTKTGHLSVPHRLSVNVTQVKRIDGFSFDITSRLVDAFPQLVWYLTSELYVGSSIILCVGWPAKWERITMASRCSVE
jgi:hypothetical protein